MPYRNKTTGEIISDQEYQSRILGKKQSLIQSRGDLIAEKQKGQETTEFLNKPFYKQIFTKQFAKEIPQATAEVGIGTPAKFLASTAEIPETIFKGKATQRTYDLPGLKPFKSYQSEAEVMAGKIIEGKEPLWKAAVPFAEVPLAGLETTGLLKGTKGLVSQGIKFITKTAEKKALQNALEITSQKITPSVGKELSAKAGREGGTRIKGIFSKKVILIPDKEDRAIAEATKTIIKKGKTYTENIANVNKTIEEHSQKVLRPYISQNSKEITEQDLQRLLGEIDTVKPGALTKANPVLKDSFEGVKNNFKDLIVSTAKNDESLYNTRILMDKIIGKETRGKAFEQVSSANDAILEIRRIINKFIANRMPDPNKVLGGLDYEHNLYSAVSRMAPKAAKEIGTTGFQRFLKSHPTIRKLLPYAGYGAAGAAGYYGVSSLISEKPK